MRFRHHCRKLIWAALVTALLAVLCAVEPSSRRDELSEGLAAIHRMGHPTNMAELAARRPADPAAEAAGAALETAVGRVQGEDEQRRLPEGFELWKSKFPGCPWNEAELGAAAVIRSNELSALARVHDALEEPKFQLATNLTAGVWAHQPQIFAFIDTASVLVLAAGWEAQMRETSAAADHLVDALELSRLLGEEPTLFTVLGSLATANIALGGLENAVNQTRLTDAELRRLQAALERDKTTDLTERCLVWEVCFSLIISDSAATNALAVFGGPSRGPATAREWLDQIVLGFYDVSGLKRADFGFYVRSMVRNLEAARTDSRHRYGLMQTNHAATKEELSRHFWYRRYSALLTPTVHDFWKNDLRVRSLRSAAVVALAVERYRLAHGDALPPTLDALVPEFLDRVPDDIFADAPLRYRRLDRGYVVYSVGPDLKDDGGSFSITDNPPDIAFRVKR